MQTVHTNDNFRSFGFAARPLVACYRKGRKNPNPSNIGIYNAKQRKELLEPIICPHVFFAPQAIVISELLRIFASVNNKYDTIMTSTAATQLTPAQINVLSLMAYIDTEQEQQELQDILLQFYRKKADSLLLQFQQEHNITQQTLDEWSNQHERTPYNVQRGARQPHLPIQPHQGRSRR